MSGPIALSADGRLVISASSDATLKLWDLSSGRELRTLAGHTHYVLAVALSADGRFAVSASGDNTVKLWNLESGLELATFICDSCPSCCAYSDALKTIVAGDAGGYLHFLRLEEPKPRS